MDSRPNIIIFNPDHYRGEALRHMGNPCVHTPNLDSLIKNDAVSFRNAFCQNPVCTPSRCCFMTGWYTHVRGHRTMFHMLRQDEPDLLSRLKNEGYFVWWGGKNDLIPAQHGFEKSCDVKYSSKREIKKLPNRGRLAPTDKSFFYGKIAKDAHEDVYHDSDWANVLGAIDQINNLPADKPFCLYLPLTSPHPPFAVEEPFFSMIDRNKVPKRIATPDTWEGKASMLKGIYEKTGMQEWTEEQWTELRAVHYGMCSRLDHQFGLIVEALKKVNKYDDTALFFFSDHGMYAGDYGLVDINQNTFEDSLTRVPFIVKPPAGIPVDPGTNEALVELTDLVATVEDLTELTPTHSHFGKSLLPLISSKQTEHRDAVFCEGGRLHGEEHCMEREYAPGHQDPNNHYYPRLSFQAEEGPEHSKAVMCRTKKLKYIRRLYEKDELYDLERDPEELNNVIEAPEYQEDINQLKERMLTWYTETSDVVPFDIDKR
jgi:arylsulfatase A-like enzyme